MPIIITTNSWLKENFSYLWVLLAFILVTDGTILAIQLFKGQPLIIGTYNMLVSLSVLFIPLITVNIIYVLKQLFLHYCKSDKQRLLLKLTGLFIGISVGTILFEWIYTSLGFVDDDYINIGNYSFSPSVSELITNLTVGVFIGVPIFVRQQVQHKASRKLNEATKELKAAHEVSVQAQLAALQARVNPHFLYNSLNSIASLIHINPNQAEKMVLSLSELFRYTLNFNNGELATVKSEIEMVNTYLEIEQVRFGDQLQVNVLVDENCQEIEIPRFLLQPIVENAIKHGTSKVSEGKISIEVQQQKEDVIITVFDNGPAFKNDYTVGYGVKCVTDQLELLYKDRYFFGMINTPEKHVKIILKNALNYG